MSSVGRSADAALCSAQSRTGITVLAAFCLLWTPISCSKGNLALGASVSRPSVQVSTGNVAAPRAISIEASIEELLAQGKNSQAEALLRVLIKEPRLDPELLLKAGAAFAQNGLYGVSERVFARCVEENPDLFEAHYDLALAYYAEQRYPQAMAVLSATHPRTRTQRLALLYMHGKIASALGHSHEARRDLAAAFAGNPRQENYALDLGICYLRQNAYPEAEKVFTKAHLFHPNSPFVGLGLALAQYLSGSLPNCIQTCRQVLSRRPGFAPIRVLLSFVLYMQGSSKEAEEIATEGLRAPEPHPYLDYVAVAASLRLQSREYERMLSEIRVAERQIPACGLCYIAQSKIDERRGLTGAAVRDLETATRLDSQSSDAWYRLAILYNQTGQHEKAVRARSHFNVLKAKKSEKEREMLRSAFMRALKSSTQ